MAMEGRTYSPTGYRYGFNGQEKDDEIKKHNSTSINYKYRMYDTRVSRFFSLDPLAHKFPYNSPYAFSENRVIDGRELEGLEVVLIGRNASTSCLLTGNAEAGIAIGPDGIFAYASTGYGIETDLGVATKLSVTIFPDMPSVMDAGGEGYSFGGSIGKGYVVSINGVSSGKYDGFNIQAGLGFSIMPASLAGTKSNTGLKALSPGAINAQERQLLTEGRNALIQQRDNLNRQSIALTEQFEILNKEANSFAAASQNAKDLNTQRKFEAKYAEKVNSMNGILNQIQKNEDNVSGINKTIEQIDKTLN